jgi:hypothetical protein
MIFSPSWSPASAPLRTEADGWSRDEPEEMVGKMSGNSD